MKKITRIISDPIDGLNIFAHVNNAHEMTIQLCGVLHKVILVLKEVIPEISIKVKDAGNCMIVVELDVEESK